MLKFGTAGLRGPLGEGPDAMNVDTVAAATAGLAAWLTERGGYDDSAFVVVGRDARHGSAEFATTAAEVFAAAGFGVMLFDRPVPTPVVAFLTRCSDAIAGVQITASHNPASDNGYKVYLDDGRQLIPPDDKEIEKHIAAVADPSAVPRAKIEPYPDSMEMIRQYLDRVMGLRRGKSHDIRIALTAMHGVGGELARSALLGSGFLDVHVVPEQFDPDPDFPTVPFPNPEEPGACDLLLALAEQIDADIAVALDPDADRCAIGLPSPTGWRMLSGDETGALLGSYELAVAPPDSLVASTFVSSSLLAKIANGLDHRHAETLTGFKWLSRAGKGLIYAYEEAIGHCVDPTAVADKDGISAAVLAADMVASVKSGGQTLLDVLDQLYVAFGVHLTAQISVRVTDLDEIAHTMKRLRADPPTSLAAKVELSPAEPVMITDWLRKRGKNRTDALRLQWNGARLVVRPSGTEPKLKCYLEIIEPVDSAEDLARAKVTAAERMELLRTAVEQLVQ